MYQVLEEGAAVRCGRRSGLAIFFPLKADYVACLFAELNTNQITGHRGSESAGIASPTDKEAEYDGWTHELTINQLYALTIRLFWCPRFSWAPSLEHGAKTWGVSGCSLSVRL